MNRTPRLPHGAPFLLLDQVLEVEERRGAFLKLVSAADPCVGRDGLLPAAFVLEALAQAGGYLAAVDEFRVHGEVRVGDALRIEVEVVRVFSSAVLLRGRALVDGTLRAEGRFTLALPR